MPKNTYSARVSSIRNTQEILGHPSTHAQISILVPFTQLIFVVSKVRQDWVALVSQPYWVEVDQS